MADVIDDLSHDHADLNRRVLEVGRVLAGRASEDTPLADQLEALREDLFLHFAREEEGVFPFAVQHLPALADRIAEMAVAHDTICGTVARMCHLAASGAEFAPLQPLYERFAAAYAAHADMEAEVLTRLARDLPPAARAALAELVRDL